jgi:hypothetical protein
VVLSYGFDNRVVNHSVLCITYTNETETSSTFNKKAKVVIDNGLRNTVSSESRCAIRLRYVDSVVSIEVAVAV